MLTKETDKASNNADWIYEIKWDGYRAIAEISPKAIQLYSRNGNDFETNYPVITNGLKSIKHHVVSEGEIVALNEKSFPDFQKIQHYADHADYPICYYVFDLLFLDGKDITHLPLTDRKELLIALLPKNEVIKYSDHIKENGVLFYNAAV